VVESISLQVDLHDVVIFADCIDSLVASVDVSGSPAAGDELEVLLRLGWQPVACEVGQRDPA